MTQRAQRPQRTTEEGNVHTVDGGLVRRSANGFVTFRTIILPNLATAMLAGGLLAFALSFDEIIVTTFTAGQQETLPIWIHNQMFRPRDRPVTNVVAMIVIAIMVLPILLAHRYGAKADEVRAVSSHRM